jgi:hypothetical protein
VGLELDQLSLVSTTEELLERKSSGSGVEIENTAVGIRHADHVAPFIRKCGTNFADRWMSLGRFSSFSDLSHEILFSFCFLYHEFCKFS